MLLPAVAVAEAPPSTGAFNAVDIAWQNPVTGENQVVIAPGGTVTFSYPSGATIHNVVFTAGNPASCTQTSGNNSGAVPPLPANPTGPGWSGSCKFDAEGTFSFVCGFHATMRGSVVVSATVPGEQPPGGGGSGGSGGSGGGSGGGSSGGPAGSKLTVAAVQHGGVVRGSVVVAGAGSRLSVDLLARRSALGGAGTKLVSAGRLSKAVGAGKRAFSVALSGAAKRAVADAGRIAVTVKLKVRPASGAAFTATKSVVVKPAG